MSWKFVLYIPFGKLSHIDEFRDIAKTIGYKFFLHNAKVYFVLEKGYAETGITVEDLV